MMILKIKLAIFLPLFLLRALNANRIAKKIKRLNDEKRYSPEWRTNYVLRRAKKVARMLRIKVIVNGYENLPKTPALLLPNHMSAFDPVAILMALQNKDKSKREVRHLAVFLSKQEIAKKRYFRGYARMIDTFYIDRDNQRDSFKTMKELVEFGKVQKRHMVIFPEGTRSVDGKLGEFKSSIFGFARQNYLQIVPVTINNSLAALNFKRGKKLTITVTFHKVIKPSLFVTMDSASIATIVKKRIASAIVTPEYVNEKEYDIV